ncbi:aminoacyl--tRNA ligase-related protein [Kitasatospora sp. NPDC097643]|uniref:aminoacyl--tRNA ligase-related protein n=1 Tax=Kitasatospora sp. NPDC097643 TaxID=3157230 RepID=UPI00332AAB93
MPSSETRGGLATLGPVELGVRQLLDQLFTAWGQEAGADPMAFPPLLRTSDLAAFDYWTNFPHLGLLATGGHPDRVAELSAGPHQEIAPELLSPAQYALPSATCYAAYLHLAGSRLDGPRRITAVGTCYRREDHYDGLRRLMGFSMREVVCVGERETVLEHIAAFTERVTTFADRLGLPLAVEAATDPFFEKDAARTLMQQLFPVKREFVYGEKLAIASVNFHRNFFGERCDITLPDGGPAFTGCVAFGLERWLAALDDRFGLHAPDLTDRILAAAGR